MCRTRFYYPQANLALDPKTSCLLFLKKNSGLICYYVLFGTSASPSGGLAGRHHYQNLHSLRARCRLRERLLVTLVFVCVFSSVPPHLFWLPLLLLVPPWSHALVGQPNEQHSQLCCHLVRCGFFDEQMAIEVVVVVIVVVVAAAAVVVLVANFDANPAVVVIPATPPSLVYRVCCACCGGTSSDSISPFLPLSVRVSTVHSPAGGGRGGGGPLPFPFVSLGHMASRTPI